MSTVPRDTHKVSILLSPEVLELLEQDWPYETSRHRLLCLATLVGLRVLGDMSPEEFLELLERDTLSTARRRLRPRTPR